MSPASTAAPAIFPLPADRYGVVSGDVTLVSAISRRHQIQQHRDPLFNAWRRQNPSQDEQ